MRIAELLASSERNVDVVAKGWVRTKRGNKNVAFIALNDGSTIHNIQVVAETASFDEALLKGIIRETSGLQCGIGPYTPSDRPAEGGANVQQALEELAARGVDVVYNEKG